MATRSFIARRDDITNEYTAIYCHWDGYPEGVGATLRDHYTDDVRVKMLVNSGGISSLHESVADSPSLNEPSVIFSDGLYPMMHHFRMMGCEYGYIWSRYDKWECFDLHERRVNLYADQLTSAGK